MSEEHGIQEQLSALLKAGYIDAISATLGDEFTDQVKGRLRDVLALLRAVPVDETGWAEIAQSVLKLTPDGDGFAALADRLAPQGAASAAALAYRSAGELDFIAEPEMDVWGGAFNGQERRQATFEHLVTALEVTSLVETGTFRGTSTGFMAKFGLPIYSCELHPRYFRYASERLANHANIHLKSTDSRDFLRDLFDTGTLPKGRTLFYLDAHWETDLPLWEEIDLIFTRAPDGVVMVDDFRVPKDLGFAYDDYGKGKCLSVSNLYQASAMRPSLFFPNYPSAIETGAAKRGSVVLALGQTAQIIAREVGSLVELSWDQALSLDSVADVGAAVADVRVAVADVKVAIDETRSTNTAGLNELKAMVNSLHDEIRASRAEAGRIAQLHNYIDRLPYTRWRRLGILLKLEKKVTIE